MPPTSRTAVLLLAALTLPLLAAAPASADLGCAEAPTPTGARLTACALDTTHLEQGVYAEDRSTIASVTVLSPTIGPYPFVGQASASQRHFTTQPPYSLYEANDTWVLVAAGGGYVPHAGAGVRQYDWHDQNVYGGSSQGRFTQVNAGVSLVEANVAQYAYGAGAPCMTDVRVRVQALYVAAPAFPCVVEVPRAPAFPAWPDPPALPPL